MVNFLARGGIIEIIERDESYRKIGSWKFSVNDKKLANTILSNLQRKYGFDKPQYKKQEKDFLDLEVNL